MRNAQASIRYFIDHKFNLNKTDGVTLYLNAELNNKQPTNVK